MKSNELIHRYLLGVASGDEVQELERRLQGDEGLQDEFLLQAELDAYLRQTAQLGQTDHEQRQTAVRSSSINVWKWVSGFSTLAAAILLTAFVLRFPPQKTAQAFPSLGSLAVNIAWEKQSIWVAAGRGDLPSLRAELQKNVPVDARLDDNLTPLHVAALFNEVGAVEVLLAAGADVSLADCEGNTALHMAAFLGHTEVVRTLLAASADPSIRNDLGFSSTDLVALTWTSALEERYHEIEEVLNTTLDLPQVRTERPTILRLLSAIGIESRDAAPTVSIWQAAITGNSAAMKQHIAAGTDLNKSEDFGGSTPLMLAAVFGQHEIAEILIDAGADLERRNYSGGTALHQACFFCQPKIVELLLQSGADPNKKNNRNLTPLDSVTIELNAELEAIYRYVYESLGLEFDQQYVTQIRHQIAQILRTHAETNAAERAEASK
jgi:ankyrin repeat protein